VIAANVSTGEPAAATNTAFYDAEYGSFARQLAAAIRAEAFDEDIGQNSWNLRVVELLATERRLTRLAFLAHKPRLW
jgi:hypothetical protein